MDNSRFKVIGAAILAALASIEEEHQVKFCLRGGTTEADGATVKLGIVEGNQEEIKAMAKAQWELFAPIFGASADAFDRRVIIDGKAYDVIGIRATQGVQYPFILKNAATGKVVRFSRSIVKHLQ